jgi:DUF1680 family protein
MWGAYQKLIREVTIPYQRDILNDAIPGAVASFAIRNFQAAAGLISAEHGGCPWQDSDLAKWLEAVAYALESQPDAALESEADGVIDLIEQAQQPDGYIDTYYILHPEWEKFSNLLENHELYCMGHMTEAAVAYFRATGKDKLLSVMRRCADLLYSRFGEGDGKANGCPGHEEIELALIKLSDVTGEERYLELAKFFLDTRGTSPNYFAEEAIKRFLAKHTIAPEINYSYFQAHKPIREQTEAAGHAVRAAYLYTGMAMAAHRTNDEGLMTACRRLWSDIVRRQLYITGAIGQSCHGESFSFGYDLPNDTVYAETCAAIGLVFFARAMLDCETKSEYADVMETALYNAIPSGMSLDGKRYFYVNPLEVWPEASEKNQSRRHVLPERPGWYGCACCPPNVARIYMSLGDYAYGRNDSTLFVHLYSAGAVSFSTPDGEAAIRVDTVYPWDGTVNIGVTETSGAAWTIALRIPGWCADPAVTLNGENVNVSDAESGYVYITRQWLSGDSITLNLPMPPRAVRANPLVRADAGKAAVLRGPVVFCMEEIDNGANLSALSINADAATFTTEPDDSLMPGAVRINAPGFRDTTDAASLYMDNAAIRREPARLSFIPYSLWANRGKGEMQVWTRIAI